MFVLQSTNLVQPLDLVRSAQNSNTELRIALQICLAYNGFIYLGKAGAYDRQGCGVCLPPVNIISSVADVSMPIQAITA